MKKLDTLYDELCSGKLDKNRAANIIIDSIYKNKSWFALGSMDMDDLHDFLLYYMERVKSVVESYDPEQGAFSSYLYGSITNALFSWRKKKKSRSLTEQSFGPVQELYFEENSEQYGIMDGHVVCQESDEQHSLEDVEEFKRIYHPVSYTGRKSYGYRKSFFSERMDNLRKEAVLILLLKCCYTISSEEIEKAAVIIGMDVETLSNLIGEAKEAMAGKKEMFDELKTARDNAFFYKRKYSILSEDSDESTINMEKIKRKKEKKEKKWKDKNEMLKGFRSIVPSNVTISKILGMSDRHVKHILKSAEKFIDNISLKRYYDWHENLFGKRKFEQEAGNE